MIRTLAVVVLIVGLALFAAAAAAVDCPTPPPIPKKCPSKCPSGPGPDCKVTTSWLLEYENCVDLLGLHHDAIELKPSDTLTIVMGPTGPTNVRFTVGDFKSFDLIIRAGVGSCPRHSGAGTVATGAFGDSSPGPSDSHTLTALTEGCYKVNLTYDIPDHPGCKIDPHIIVKQPAPTALEKKKH